MKSKRQEQILALIQDHDIETQEQLLDELKKSGFQATQATISRDIKQLRIIKELGPNGTYRYVSSPKPVEHAFSAKLNMIFRQCVTSIDYAQNLIVIKTMPGLANAACSAIDKLELPDVYKRQAGGNRPAAGTGKCTAGRVAEALSGGHEARAGLHKAAGQGGAGGCEADERCV